MNTVEKYELQGFTIEIMYDEQPWSPLTNTTVGTLLYGHRRYTFDGAVQGEEWEAEYEAAYGEAPTSWRQWERFVREHKGATVVLPVYMYDHSGLAIEVGEHGNPFTCQWDSGLLGLYFDTAEGREECGTDPEHIPGALRGEVQEFACFVAGEVYGYVVTDPEGVEVDSCWGFIGEIGYAKSEAESAVEWEIKSRAEEDAKVARMPWRI